MSHLSQSTHNSVLAWMDEASAYLNWYPVFLCSQKQWVFSLQASLAAALVSHCQHVLQKGKLKICVKFSSHYMKKEGCSCSKWSDQTDGKTAFSFTSMSDWATIGYSVTFIHITLVKVIIHHNFWLYHIALYMAQISFLWMVNVSHYAYVFLVHPLYCFQVAPSRYLNVPHFSFMVLRHRSSSMHFLLSLTVPQQLVFY